MFSSFKGELSDKKQLTKDVYLFTFDLSQDFLFTAGQYVILLVPQEGGFAQRQYSIASSSRQARSIDLIVKLIPSGVASEYLEKLQHGNPVDFRGPAGMFTLSPSLDEVSTFLLTGTGVAPFMSMLRTGVFDQKEVELFWGLRTREDLYFFDELHSYSKQNSAFRFYVCFSREDMSKLVQKSAGQFMPGRITNYFHRFLKSTKKQRFYICGNRDVVESVRGFLLENNITKTQITFEKF